MTNIEKVINELQACRNIDKSKFFEEQVNLRLNKSLIEYYNQLNKAFDKLSCYDDSHDLRLVKRLNKEI